MDTKITRVNMLTPLGGTTEDACLVQIYGPQLGRKLTQLRKSGKECRIYGYKRDLTSDVREGNLIFKPFSEAGFIDDLRTARGVVGGGGYTLMSEAVYLKKPMLSVPIGGQFEQVLNALYLQKLNYGMHAKALDGKVLGEFLDRVDGCAKSLEGFTQDGNTALLAKLDAVLRDAASLGKWDETTVS